MKKPILIGAFLATIVVLVVAGTKISRLTRTTTIQGNSIFLVVTGEVGNLETRGIEGTNLVTALSALPNWPISAGGGGASTNANQFGAAGNTLTLKSGVRTTNQLQYGITTNAGDAYKINGVNDPYFEITSILLPQTLYAKSTGIGTRSGGGQAYISFYPEETLTVEMATDVFRPANGVSIDIGAAARPFRAGYFITSVSASNILLGPVVKIMQGDGSPEGSISANPQSVYFQTNQITGIGMWLKTNGTGSTGWWLLSPGGGGGGLSDGDKGDVVVGSSGSDWQLDARSVGFPELRAASVTQRVMGRDTSGSGDFEEVKISSILDWMGGTQGMLLYRGASGWTNLGAGTSGQLLQTPGPGGNPLWATVGTLTDSDKTDITVSGSGTIFTIDPSAVTGSKVLDGTIQFADITNAQDNFRVIGSGTNGNASSYTELAISTNSFHPENGLYSKTLQNNRNEFWDDFDGPTMNSSQFLRRRSPSGHSYRLYSIDAEGTNGFQMFGGRLRQTQNLYTPFYLSVSNDAPSFARPWNRFGAVLTWVSNTTPTVYFDQFGLINSEKHDLSTSDYLHTTTDILGNPVIQRSLTEYILQEVNGASMGAGSYHNQRRVVYEINVFSNSVVMQIGGWYGTRYYTNLAAFSRWPNVIWEIFGSATNEINCEIESIWAGYADPALEVLANGPRKLGTNLSEVTEITLGTLVGANGGAAGGTYTNKEQDTIIALGNGLAAAGTARTNKLWNHNNGFGKSVLIVDTGQTATGSNIVVETMDGALIYPGAAVRTNITENGGSLELMRTAQGWNVVRRPTTIIGATTNANQFAAVVPLTIKKLAQVTNVIHYGTLSITNPENGGSVGFIDLSDNGIFGGNSGNFSMGNSNLITGLTYKHSGNTINPFVEPNASLGSNAPFNGIYGTNISAVRGMLSASESVSGTSTNGSLRITNYVDRLQTNATATTASIDWDGPGLFRYAPGGTFTLSFVNTPAASTAWRKMEMELLTAQSGTFPAGIDWGADAGPILVSGATNKFLFIWNGTNVAGHNLQVLTDGTGPYALMTNGTFRSVGEEHIRTNLNVKQIVSTNGVAYVNSTISGVGGANTNFTGQATDGVVYINGGTTNVNFVAVMPGTDGLTYFPTYVISNLTTTARNVSLAATTNFWRNLQQYDGVTAPFVLTNKHTGILSVMLNGTNSWYTWKQSTNGF